MPADAKQPLDDRLFTLAVMRLADSLSSGNDPSPYRGTGVDFAQCRPYVPGDSVKAIDWRVTGRTGKVHIKEYESIKNIPMYMLLDRSASMGASSAASSKWDWAVALCGALGLAAIRRSSPFGIFCTGSDSNGLEFPPSLSTDRLYQRLHGIRRVAADCVDVTQVSGTIDRMVLSLREKSLVLVMSDLHEHGLVDKLKRMAQKHEALVLRLRDPAEGERRRRGLMIGQEAETSRKFSVFRRHQPWGASECRSQLLSAGIPTLDLWTHEDFIPALREFLRQRLASAGVR